MGGELRAAHGAGEGCAPSGWAEEGDLSHGVASIVPPFVLPVRAKKQVTIGSAESYTARPRPVTPCSNRFSFQFDVSLTGVGGLE